MSRNWPENLLSRTRAIRVALSAGLVLLLVVEAPTFSGFAVDTFEAAMTFLAAASSAALLAGVRIGSPVRAARAASRAAFRSAGGMARRWSAGVRLDHSERADDPSLVDKGVSALLTYWPSEFSQIRGQYRHARYGDGIKADELLFQFLFSIGAHGAHTF